MRKLFVVLSIVAGMVLAIWSPFLFRSEPMLTSVADWVTKSWGGVLVGAVTTCGGIAITFILARANYWQSPEFKKHEELLLNEIHQLAAIQSVPDRDVSLVHFWRGTFQEFPVAYFGLTNIPGWTAKYFNNSLVVRVNLRDSDIWPFVLSHLKNSKLLTSINEWELATNQDLIARKSLFESIFAPFPEVY